MDGSEVHKKLVALNSGKDFTKALLTIGVRCVAYIESVIVCCFFGGVVGGLVHSYIPHTIHGTGMFTYIWLSFMA